MGAAWGVGPHVGCVLCLSAPGGCATGVPFWFQVQVTVVFLHKLRVAYRKVGATTHTPVVPSGLAFL